MAAPRPGIIYPTLPKSPKEQNSKEEDPRVRINVMIDIFNAGLPTRDSRGKIDQGFYHEIQTAMLLVREFKVTHGNQISRPLTAKEKKAGLSGTSQMIMVPLGGKNARELDMVYEKNGIIHIVEAKSKANADTSQLKANVDLARQLGGEVVYALEGQKPGQEKALKDAHDKLPKGGNLPPLQVIQIPSDGFAKMYFDGYIAGLGSIATLEGILDSDHNPDAGHEYESDWILKAAD